MPESDNKSINVKPLTTSEPVKAGRGRPRNLIAPPMPDMPMSTGESSLFHYFVEAYKEQYPDMVPTDHLILYLAGLEFIKYLRVVQEELETNKVISMARQHPGVNMRALLDQLSVTRKARNSGRATEDPAIAEARQAFLGMSQ